MKTEIEAIIKALDAFKAKLAESEQSPVDPEKELLMKAQDNAGDGVEVDSYHRLGWYRMAGGGLARIKRTHSKYVLGDATEAGCTFDCTMWEAETGEHVTNGDWNLIRWKGGEQ